MSHKIVFLGWDQPWTELFGRWLAREPDRLRRRLVVLPTRESGRRLREWLASQTGQNGGGAILGPRVATPDDFFRPAEAMPDAIRWAGWLGVLRETKDDAVAALFPAGVGDQDDAWRLAVARQIEQARELLISGDADFAAVAQKLPEEQARWQELAKLEHRVGSVWKQWGWADPVQAKRMRARDPVRPQGVDEIILAGVADPTGLAVAAWRRLGERGIPITVLVGAPMDFQAAFDDWGRPKPEFWSDRRQHTTPEPTGSLVAANAVALAEAVLQACADRSNRDVAVGVCDSTFAPAIARRFQEAGWLTFDPEGMLLAKDGWPEFLEALAAALDSPNDFSALIRVAQHPVAWAQWQRGIGKMAPASIAAIARWEVQSGAANSSVSIEGLGMSGSGQASFAIHLLTKLHEAIKAAAAGETEAFEKELRAWFQEGAAEAASHALTEMGAWPRLAEAGFGLSLRLKWLAASLATVSRSSDSSDAVLALQGWLELPFDPAPQLILAGVHEGRIPEAPPADALLTEAVREKLGLRDRKSRLAREVFLYTAMVEGRRAKGSVTVVTAQVDGKGEPCQPSRVLLQARPECLPKRVLKFVKDTPDVPLQHTPAWSRGHWWLATPPDDCRRIDWPNLSPSDLKAYLACPTRFYFEKVLCWEKFEPFNGELNAGRFGDLIHGVLSRWGHDAEARELDDPVRLRDCWLDLLKAEATERFGDRASPLIRMQLMSVAERLGALAQKQAEQRQLGWQVAAVEKKLKGVLKLAGMPLHLRLDRLDRHPDGRMRVIDYKTSKKPEAPRLAHLRPWSKEKCPAPLGPLCVVKGKGNGQDKSYVWTDLQLPLYVAAVKKEWKLDAAPEAFYALMPEAVGDTEFAPFEELNETLENALKWAEEAARRITAGVFWPPAPEVKYDNFAALAPEGLEHGLGEEWAKFLAGDSQAKGGNAT